MSTLFVLNASPFITCSWRSWLRLMSSGDGLLLCGDAVYFLQDGTPQNLALRHRAQGIALYALQEDIEARFLNRSLDELEIVDYPRFVELTLQYDKVVTE